MSRKIIEKACWHYVLWIRYFESNGKCLPIDLRKCHVLFSFHLILRPLPVAMSLNVYSFLVGTVYVPSHLFIFVKRWVPSWMNHFNFIHKKNPRKRVHRIRYGYHFRCQESLVEEVFVWDQVPQYSIWLFKLSLLLHSIWILISASSENRIPFERFKIRIKYLLSFFSIAYLRKKSILFDIDFKCSV